jgi:hypothetical protein
MYIPSCSTQWKNPTLRGGASENKPANPQSPSIDITHNWLPRLDEASLIWCGFPKVRTRKAHELCIPPASASCIDIQRTSARNRRHCSLIFAPNSAASPSGASCLWSLSCSTACAKSVGCAAPGALGSCAAWFVVAAWSKPITPPWVAPVHACAYVSCASGLLPLSHPTNRNHERSYP